MVSIRHLTTFFCHFMIDICILIMLGAGIAVGVKEGFIKQLISLGGLIVGLFFARLIYALVVEKMCPVTSSVTVAQILAFVIVWIGIPIACSFAAGLITHLVKMVRLGAFNGVLGGILGGLKYLLLMSALFCVLDFADPHGKFIKNESKQDSSMYQSVKGAVGLIFPAAVEVTNHYILNKNDATRRQQK